MAKTLDWTVIIRNETYNVTFSVEKLLRMSNDPVRISRMYGLERNGFNYVLSILTNGTYRLYSKGRKKLYVKGRLNSIKFIPKTKISKTIH